MKPNFDTAFESMICSPCLSSRDRRKVVSLGDRSYQILDNVYQLGRPGTAANTFGTIKLVLPEGRNIELIARDIINPGIEVLRQALKEPWDCIDGKVVSHLISGVELPAWILRSMFDAKLIENKHAGS